MKKNGTFCFKKTFLFLKALETTDRKQREKLIYFMAIPKARNDEKVRGVITIYNELVIKNTTQNEANKHTGEAIKHLQLVNTNPEKKKNLEEMVLNLLNRKN